MPKDLNASGLERAFPWRHALIPLIWALLILGLHAIPGDRYPTARLDRHFSCRQGHSRQHVWRSLALIVYCTWQSREHPKIQGIRDLRVDTLWCFVGVGSGALVHSTRCQCLGYGRGFCRCFIGPSCFSNRVSLLELKNEIVKFENSYPQ